MASISAMSRRNSCCALGIAQAFGAQAQPGQRCAQVVRHRRHKPVALSQLLADARLHLVEHAAGVAAFQRAVLWQRGAVDVAAQLLRGRGQPVHGAGQPACRPPGCTATSAARRTPMSSSRPSCNDGGAFQKPGRSPWGGWPGGGRGRPIGHRPMRWRAGRARRAFGVRWAQFKHQCERQHMARDHRHDEQQRQPAKQGVQATSAAAATRAACRHHRGPSMGPPHLPLQRLHIEQVARRHARCGSSRASAGRPQSLLRRRETSRSMLRSNASMARPRACSMSWSRLKTRRGMRKKVHSKRNSALDNGTTTPCGRHQVPLDAVQRPAVKAHHLVRPLPGTGAVVAARSGAARSGCGPPARAARRVCPCSRRPPSPGPARSHRGWRGR